MGGNNWTMRGEHADEGGSGLPVLACTRKRGKPGAYPWQPWAFFTSVPVNEPQAKMRALAIFIFIVFPRQ